MSGGCASVLRKVQTVNLHMLIHVRERRRELYLSNKIFWFPFKALERQKVNPFFYCVLRTCCCLASLRQTKLIVLRCGLLLVHQVISFVSIKISRFPSLSLKAQEFSLIDHIELSGFELCCSCIYNSISLALSISSCVFK